MMQASQETVAGEGADGRHFRPTARAGSSVPKGRSRKGGAFHDPSFMGNRDAPVHRWVPWIAGYSKYFVEDAITCYTSGPSVVLDPFAGVGTTLVEADLAGHDAIGFEINPYAAFAAQTKLRAHTVDRERLVGSADRFMDFMRRSEQRKTDPRTRPPGKFRTRAPFYSPKVERKVLLALDFVAECPPVIRDIYRLAFAATMVQYSNYSYEPSLGRKKTVGRPEVDDCDVAGVIRDKVLQIADDAAWYHRVRRQREHRHGRILNRSFFNGYAEVNKGSVDLLITSPPYLNNYHYNRNTRPHLYWLGFCSSPKDLKRLEELNFGTYWQNARDQAQVHLDPCIKDEQIRETLSILRQQNPHKGLYGGIGWANYAARYFNDCAKFARGAAWCLRRGATALVVVGNSILQGVPIPTDRFLAKIAALHDFDVVAVHVPRKKRVGNSILNSSVRAGKTNGSALYESVVELRRS
ncbi:MAG: DNA methyltransferase [Bryobacterales bacterium]|nr:DNA methyltransferase [Bryobacterales bacterium]